MSGLNLDLNKMKEKYSGTSVTIPNSNTYVPETYTQSTQNTTSTPSAFNTTNALNTPSTTTKGGLNLDLNKMKEKYKGSTEIAEGLSYGSKFDTNIAAQNIADNFKQASDLAQKIFGGEWNTEEITNATNLWNGIVKDVDTIKKHENNYKTVSEKLKGYITKENTKEYEKIAKELKEKLPLETAKTQHEALQNVVNYYEAALNLTQDIFDGDNDLQSIATAIYLWNNIVDSVALIDAQKNEYKTIANALKNYSEHYSGYNNSEEFNKVFNQAKREEYEASQIESYATQDEIKRLQDIYDYAMNELTVEVPYRSEGPHPVKAYIEWNTQGAFKNAESLKAYIDQQKALVENYQASKQIAQIEGIAEKIGEVKKDYASKLPNNEYMTEKQRLTYNKLSSKESYKYRAEQYWGLIQESVNYTKAVENFEKIKDKEFAKFVYSVPAGLERFGTGVVNTVKSAKDALTGSESNYNQSAMQMTSSLIKQDKQGTFGGALYDISENISYMLPVIAVSVLSKSLGAKLAKGAATKSLGEALVKSAGSIGRTTMGASSYGNAYAEMINAGYNKTQATTYGALVAASEMLLTDLLSNVSGIGGGKLTAQVIKDIDSVLVQFAVKHGGEAVEEGLQTILESVFKSAVTGEIHEADVGEVLYASLLGFASSAVIGGAETSIGKAINKISSNIDTKKTKATSKIADFALTMPTGSLAKSLATMIKNNQGAYDMAVYLGERNVSMSEKGVQAFADELQSRGMDVDSSMTIADAIGKVTRGAELSTYEQNTLNKNEVVTSALMDSVVRQDALEYGRINEYNEIIKSEEAPTSETVQTKESAVQPEEVSNLENVPEQAENTINRNVTFGKEITNEQSNEYKPIADKLGVKVHVFDSITNSKGKQVGGFINTKTGEMYLNAQFGDFNKITVKHELTHTLENLTKKDTTSYYDLFNNATETKTFKKWLEEKGYKDIASLRAEVIKDRQETGDENFNESKSIEELENLADNEILADFIGEMLYSDADGLKRMVDDLDGKNKRNVIQLVLDAIRSLIDKIKGIDHSFEKELRKMEKQFAKMLNESADVRAEESKNNPKEAIEEKKDMLILHNLTEEQLRKALAEGGIIKASTSVSNQSVTQFGDISAIVPLKVLDPSNNQTNKLWGTDAWTPQQNKLKKNAVFNEAKTNEFVNDIKNTLSEHNASELFDVTPEQFMQDIKNETGNIIESHAQDIGVETAYALDNGLITDIPFNKDGTVNQEALTDSLEEKLHNHEEWSKYRKWLFNTSDSIIESYDKANEQDVIENMEKQPATKRPFKLFADGKLTVPAVEYSTVEELKRNRNRLDTKENVEAQTKAVANEFLTLANQLGDKKTVVKAINNAFDSRYSVTDIRRSFKQQGINLSKENTTKLQELYKKAVELPTQYFEGKFGDKLNIDQIGAFVVPNTIDTNLKQELINRGFEVAEYDPSVEGDRERVKNMFEQFKFSIPKETNTKYSIPKETRAEIIKKVEDGQITAAEAEQLLDKAKKKPLQEIVDITNLIPESVKTRLDAKKKLQTKPADRESSFIKNIEKSKLFDNEFKNEAKNDNFISTYASVTNRDTLQKAVAELDEGGSERVREWYITPANKITLVDEAIGFVLLERAKQAGDVSEQVAIAQKLREIGTVSGQRVQLFSILGRMTPEGMYQYAEKELSTALELMTKLKTQRWFDKNADSFKLTEADREFIPRRVRQAQTLPDGSRAKNIVLAEIATRIQNKIPADAGQSIKALQRISMLLNAKTNIRNIASNVASSGQFLLSDLFGSPIDALITKNVAKKGFDAQRTTGFGNVKENIKALGRGLFNSYDDFRRKINTRNTEQNRFEVGEGPSFNENTKNKTVNAVAHAFNEIDRLTGFLLDAGDRPFYEMWFTNSINAQMRLNNVTEPTVEMIEIATEEALQRTWQDTNGYTKATTAAKNLLNAANLNILFPFAANYGLGDVLLKFTKTPANLAKAIVDFSPAGLLHALSIDAHNFNKELGKNNYDVKLQKKLVNNLSKGIAGTLIQVVIATLVSGAILKMTGESDEDDDVKAFENYIKGIPAYSIKIGDTYVTYDWAQPLGAYLATVADYMQAKEENPEGDLGEALLSAISAGGDVLLQQSFLYSLQNLFKSFSSESSLIENVVSAMFNDQSVYVPQLLSQLAEMTDEHRRVTYSQNNFERMINKIKVKIPGLRQTLEPEYNVLGEKAENPRSDVFNAFFNPGNVYSRVDNEVVDEVYALYKSTGDKTAIMPKADSYVTAKGNKYKYTPSEKSTVQQVQGRTAVSIIDKAMDDKAYEQLDDEQKIKFLSEVYSYAKAKAKSSVVYSYDFLHSIYGDVLTEKTYNSLSDSQKKALASEYFMNSYSKLKEGEEVEYFLDKVDASNKNSEKSKKTEQEKNEKILNNILKTK